MFEPSKPLLDFVRLRRETPNLKAALATMATQKNADKLQEVEIDIDAAYEQALETCINEPNNTNFNINAQDGEENRENIDLAAVTSHSQAPEEQCDDANHQKKVKKENRNSRMRRKDHQKQETKGPG